MKRKFNLGDMALISPKYIRYIIDWKYFEGCRKVTRIKTKESGYTKYSIEVIEHAIHREYYSWELNKPTKEDCNKCKERFKCWTS